MRFDESFRMGFRLFYRDDRRIFCAAKRFNRAHIAFGLPGHANQRSKIEQSGVENRRIGLWEQKCCMLPKSSPAQVGIDRFAQIEKPRQKASSVGLDDRNRLIKGKAGNRVRGVFADAGKLSHLVCRAWEISVMPFHNGFCRGVEISGTSVITEALPRAKHLVFRGPCQRGEIGKRAEPLVIVRDDSGDLSLLQHELGDENCVRIAGPAPGEIPSMLSMPT